MQINVFKYVTMIDISKLDILISCLEVFLMKEKKVEKKKQGCC